MSPKPWSEQAKALKFLACCNLPPPPRLNIPLATPLVMGGVGKCVWGVGSVLGWGDWESMGRCGKCGGGVWKCVGGWGEVRKCVWRVLGRGVRNV